MLMMNLKVYVLAIVAVTAVGAVSAREVDAAEQFTVDFRLKAWKTAHFNDAKTADANYKTFEKLGCQAKKGSHGGHFDVSYVCPKWRRISLKKHSEADSWVKWLKSNGFETKHKH